MDTQKDLSRFAGLAGLSTNTKADNSLCTQVTEDLKQDKATTNEISTQVTA